MYEPMRSKGPSQTVEEPHQAVHETQGHLSPQTFAGASKSRRRRACRQVTVGLSLSLLMLWPLYLYGTLAAVFSASDNTYSTSANRFCNADRKSTFTFFEPDTVMGNFTLGQAKAIDVGWNIVVGRGSQAIMGYTSYSVVASALMRIAEVTPVKYNLFAGLVFYPTGVLTIPHLIKGVWSLRGWRPKFAMVWLLFSSVVILAMPTLIDASSGYLQPQSLFYAPGDSITNHGPNYGPYESLPRVFATGQVSEEEYTCKSDGAYQWGFSSGWFLTIMALIPVWFFGTYCMWLDSQHNSELTRKGRSMGTWRAVADLAEAMTIELGPHANGYSNKQLEKVLENRPPMKYDALVDEQGMNHIVLTPRQSTKLELSYEATYG
jgi:hypothetical protein